jgi:hypothetical protein
MTMGLDMYLKYRKNVSGYESVGDSSEYKALVEAAGLSDIASTYSPYLTMEVTVAYWRKVNAVHGWFVSELAAGRDECQEIPVTRENLQQLRDTCFEALSVPAGVSLTDHANEVLPPIPGFFFGATEVDEYYVRDLEDTMDQIDRVLSNLPADGEGWDWNLTYQASW